MTAAVGSLSLLARERALPEPEDLGPMLDAREIASIIYEGKVSTRWVLDNHAPLYRFQHGRKCFWYEKPSRAWKRQQELRQMRAAKADAE